MSFLRHARSIGPMWVLASCQARTVCRLPLVGDGNRHKGATEIAPLLIVRDESHRLSLGGLLSSRARLRFAGCIQFAIKEYGRLRNFQRTANSVLTVCVSSGDKRKQEQVARVARQLDDVRRELDKSRTEEPKIQQKLKTIDNEATQTTDPQKRKDLDDALRMFKLQAEQAEKSLQQLQAREGELVSQLQAEQAKLTELNDRMEQIERSLTTP
jgi:DNA repair exonuclease SbcCD ATPase subunit